ncbi:hypothetical protein B0H15DRAFT_780981, partial [Mycena belliarum]
DEVIAGIRNKRRYRLLLLHDFHPSLTLPLWNPLPLAVGAVGYLRHGKFVTLLNCFYPDKAANGGGAGLPSVQNVARRYSFPLRAGHKTAYLCTESTVYRYIENLDAPKKWFKANVDAIMQQYGEMAQIQKEDLYLVIGTLDAPDYALFVSHNHPDGQAHFNVFSAPKTGQPWGTFTTDAEVSASQVSATGGPWDTVLVARLRFKPDVAEPTSL